VSLLEENLIKQIACSFKSLPLSTCFKLTLARFIPWKWRQVLEIKLPYNLRAYIPVTVIDAVWRNVLHIFWYRDYELVKNFIPKKGWKVIDIGCFIGLWLLKVSRFIGENGIVIGFEPNPLAYKIARMNVEINMLRNAVVHDYAIGAKNGESILYIPRDYLNSSLLREYVLDMSGEYIKALKVRVVTLRRVLETYKLHRIDLVKIDVEGYEEVLLRSCKNILRGDNIKRLIIEVHKNVVEPGEIMDLLEELEWDVVLIDLGLEVQAFIYAIKG